MNRWFPRSSRMMGVAGLTTSAQVLATTALTMIVLCAASNSHAGAFIFAGENNGIDIVTHPTGYSGTGGHVTVNVCIKGSANTVEMEQSVRNVVAVYNRLRPTTGNLKNGKISPSTVDFESVLLHELGHCLGLAHPNLASESQLDSSNWNYTKSTDGNNGFDVASGTDNVKGSADDIRGDDVNLHWFRMDNNNPFTIDTLIDSSTYRRNTADLPIGHAFAANADRTVGSAVLNTPASEAAMQQGTFFGEIQRTLVPDDVATLRYAMAGLDEQAGTADDYTFSVQLDPTGTDCDIDIQFDNSQTGFAVCQVSGLFRSQNHIEITSGNIFFNNDFNWHFNNARPCSKSLDLTQGQWALISLPCDVGISTGETVADVFGDDLDGTYGTDWVVYERDAVGDSYTKLSLDSPLTTGKGYWITTDFSNQAITVEGQHSSALDIGLAGDPDGRFNLVGHPLDFAVDWNNVQIIDGPDILTLEQADPSIGGKQRACDTQPVHESCRMSRIVYQWNGSAYQIFDGETPGAEGLLSPFGGFWVRSYKPGIALRIPALASTTSGQDSLIGKTADASPFASTGRSGSSPERRSVRFVRLIAESETHSDPGNLIGFLPDSRNRYDKHDIEEIPPFSDEYLTIVFPHSNWKRFAGDYTTDFRSARGARWAKWHFEVRTSLPIGTEVVIRWEAPKALQRSARLIDRANNTSIRVRNTTEYRFRIKGKRHRFVWKMRRPQPKRQRNRNKR